MACVRLFSYYIQNDARIPNTVGVDEDEPNFPGHTFCYRETYVYIYRVFRIPHPSTKVYANSLLVTYAFIPFPSFPFRLLEFSG